MRSNPIGNIWAITSEMFGRKLVFVLIALGGALIYSLQRFVSIGRDQVYSKPGSSELRGALLIPPAAYLAFSLFHFQGPDDVIPLCPFIGIFAGYFFVQLVNSASLLSRGKVFAYLRSLIPMFASFAIVALIIASRVSYIEEPGGTLKNQSEAYQAISNALSPDDKIYVHGAVEILVLLNRANLNQYIYVDRGRDEYINEHTPGGFKSLIDAMESEAPKIVCLAHMGKRKTSYGWMLFEWTAEHYEELPLSLFNETSVFIRKK